MEAAALGSDAVVGGEGSDARVRVCGAVVIRSSAALHAVAASLVAGRGSGGDITLTTLILGRAVAACETTVSAIGL